MNERHQLTCCCCGRDAGLFAQHWNRDTGFSICRRCLNAEAKTADARTLESRYGKEGINYAADQVADTTPDLA